MIAAINAKVAASVQHEEAQKALTVIARKAKVGGRITYGQLASALGHGPKHSRAMAQVCDLLDSAATLAHRPLMALWTVRNAKGKINSAAWVKNTPPGLRELLIAEARGHRFSEADEAAILKSLNQLSGMGNRKAWTHVHRTIPHAQMFARLEGRELSSKTDSLNDLGTDDPDVTTSIGRRYERDLAVRNAVIQRANGTCEFCGQLGFKKPDGSRYLESHHIIALSNDGQDRMNNVIALCSGHHREAHFGALRAEMERKMVVIVQDKNKEVTISN